MSRIVAPPTSPRNSPCGGTPTDRPLYDRSRSLEHGRSRSAAQRDGERLPSLIVAPASLLANWAAEAERFAPSLKVFVAHPAFATADTLAAPEAALAKNDVVVISYSALLRFGWIAKTRWRFVVLDEAQAIKNPGAKQTRAVKALEAEGRIALTGTPVENNLGDLWSIFDFLNPGLLGSTKAFQGFAKRLADQTPPSYAPLRRLIAPYILRRMKTDRSVIADLLDKTEVKRDVGRADVFGGGGFWQLPQIYRAT